MKIYSYIFFQEFYYFTSYAEVYDAFWVNFGLWKEVGVQIHSLASGCSLVLAPFVGRLLFPRWILTHSPKSIAHKCEGLFLDFQFYSLDLYVYPYVRTILSWLLQLRNRYGKCESYRCVLPFQDYFEYSGFLEFPHEF